MLCKHCYSRLVYGWSAKLRRRVRLCTSCGRADMLDYSTGLLMECWQPRRYGRKAG